MLANISFSNKKMRLNIFKNVFFFYFWSHNSTVTIQIIAFVQIIAQPSSSIF